MLFNAEGRRLDVLDALGQMGVVLMDAKMYHEAARVFSAAIEVGRDLDGGRLQVRGDPYPTLQILGHQNPSLKSCPAG